MQTFTDLVGTTAVPAHAFDIAELTDLTPTLDTAMAAHDIAEASELDMGPRLCNRTAVDGSPAAERPTEINL